MFPTGVPVVYKHIGGHQNSSESPLLLLQRPKGAGREIFLSQVQGHEKQASSLTPHSLHTQFPSHLIDTKDFKFVKLPKMEGQSLPTFKLTL